MLLKIDTKSREGVIVLPPGASVTEAKAFAQAKAGWLSRQLRTLPDARPIAPGKLIPVRGEDTRLVLPETGRRASLLVSNRGPELHAPGDAATFEPRVIRFLKREAKQDLEAAVARHCDRLGITRKTTVSVKDTRSRWGSCSSSGRVSFSWRLVLAPPKVLDYVAAHECAHLLEMNHSPAFWAHVHTTFGDHRGIRAWLRRNGEALHAVGLADSTASDTASGRVPATAS